MGKKFLRGEAVDCLIDGRWEECTFIKYLKRNCEVIDPSGKIRYVMESAVKEIPKYGGSIK